MRALVPCITQVLCSRDGRRRQTGCKVNVWWELRSPRAAAQVSAGQVTQSTHSSTQQPRCNYRSPPTSTPQSDPPEMPAGRCGRNESWEETSVPKTCCDKTPTGLLEGCRACVTPHFIHECLFLLITTTAAVGLKGYSPPSPCSWHLRKLHQN